jgi:hypothetical protein
VFEALRESQFARRPEPVKGCQAPAFCVELDGLCSEGQAIMRADERTSGLLGEGSNLMGSSLL